MRIAVLGASGVLGLGPLVRVDDCAVERPTLRPVAQRAPTHPYTRMLLDSIPRVGWDPGRIAAERRALAL